MDKKQKKRLEVLRKRQEKCQQQLVGARSQPDDPSEVPRLEAELAEIKQEIEKLKSA